MEILQVTINFFLRKTGIKHWIDCNLCYLFWQPHFADLRHYFIPLFIWDWLALKTMKNLEMQLFVMGCFLAFYFVTEPTVHTTTFQFNQFWQQMTGVEVTGFSDAVKSKKIFVV